MNVFKIENRNLEMTTNDLRDGRIIPGTIYGKNISSTPIRATNLELNRVTSKLGEVYKVDFDGKSYFTKLHEVQTSPVTGKFMHFSLVEMPKGETSTLEVPLTTKGEAKGEKEGGTVVVLNDMISINGLVKDMPQELVADVSKMEIGDKITLNDLKLPKNLSSDLDMEEAIIVCRPPDTIEQEQEQEPEVEEGLNTPETETKEEE